jgi:hypothetical protein
MAYGFHTTKTESGFAWAIVRTEWSDALGHSVTTTVKNGVRATRAQALGSAKRWVLFFRKGGVAA